MALTDKLTAIADAIRAKTGKSDTMTLDGMVTEISSITGGSSTVDNKKYFVKDTKRVDTTLKLWSYKGYAGNANFEAVSPYTNKYQTFTTGVLDLSGYNKACITVTAIEYYTDTSYPTQLNLIASTVEYNSSLSTGNGYLHSDHIIKKVSETPPDVKDGFVGAYLTIELDLSDVASGALVFESCKCCTTILDFWVE